MKIKPAYTLLFLMILRIAARPLLSHCNPKRPLVIEEFSGVWCTFCYGASIAVDMLHAEYSQDELIVVKYHMEDEFMIPFGYNRYDAYQVSGYPTSIFNGLISDSGGSSFQQGPAPLIGIRNRYIEIMDAERDRIGNQFFFDIALEGDLNPDNPSLTLTIESLEPYNGNVQAVFLITEEGIPVQAPNGQHVLNSLARAHLGTEPIVMDSRNTIIMSIQSEDPIPFFQEDRLHPVVYLQDEDTCEILAAIGEFSETAIQVWELY